MKTLVALLALSCLFLTACKKDGISVPSKNQTITISFTGIPNGNFYSFKAVDQKTHVLILRNLKPTDSTYTVPVNSGDVVEIDWDFSNNINRSGVGRIVILNNGSQVYDANNAIGLGTGGTYKDYIQ